MKTATLRAVVASAVLALCVGPIGIAAFVLGFAHGESPCVLCWAQRMGMILIALTGLMILRFGPRPRYIGLGILVSAHGLYMALRHASLHLARDVGQGFAIEIMGAHTYIWSGVIFGAALALMGGLLLLIGDGRVRAEGSALGGLGRLTAVVFLVAVAGNVLQALAATGPPPFMGQGDPVRFSFDPRHWVWSLDEWKTGAISWRGPWGIEKPDATSLATAPGTGPLAGLGSLPVKRRLAIGAELNGAVTGAAYDAASDRFVLTTDHHGVYLVGADLETVLSHVVIDPGYSVDIGRLAGAAFLDQRTVLVVSENKSYVVLESRGPEAGRDDYRYFLETSGDLAEIARSRFATLRARMHYVMSLGYGAETDSLYTVSVPNRRHRTLVVSRFDRRDLELSEEFLPRLAGASGLALRSDDRSLGELYVTGLAVEGSRLYALSAAYGTLLVIDLDRGEVVAAYGVAGLVRPTALALRGSELYIVSADGAVSVVDEPAPLPPRESADAALPERASSAEAETPAQ
jgi:disulfide bond formation protein DsbB